MSRYFKSFYNWYLGGLTLLISLPILAPVTLHLGLTSVAKVLYFIYSFFCHQFASRSFHLYDYQFAWCSRDTGIWLGIWLIALFIKLKKISGIKWYWVIPFVIPIALDGGLQTIFTVFNISPAGILVGEPLYISNNLTRFITGSIFGIGISLWLSPLVMNESVERVKEKASRLNVLNLSKKKFKAVKILLIMIAMLPVYLGIVALWDSTSTVNDPLPPIDAVVKTPSGSFFARRDHGACPTDDINNFLALDCFFK